MVIWLVLIACAFLRAVFVSIAYCRQARFDRLDSEYRAAALVANAKREVRRA
ncbi:hypothetical protein [Xanthomonas euvesicatoria]|uniref:hypothetical protein n=1 Tax=Xanthomonas euvesicatoria TaxID=456327 RepID=UPI0013E0E412|nr:hypothetical protein [Xanthomonas euvesicatoria]MDW7708532.1 hypothetical protein [Xanthomonas euvesicatoria]MDW7708544.1 hypothetical protein [Xanthomonas euvesicatoria]MDW7716686.1 hypothetical protein [Xanthomonas euvesicatoria]MDW7720868.1 hypothetical protein [Xanthomonas euvesicatoria]MDW7781353.1 hypothetical protein [Xanthomonas euvesicatoria]